MLTRVAERFVEQPGEGFGFCGALASRLSDLRDILEVALRLSGHPIWLRKQIKMRAARRSWYKNRFGGMMTSPLTLV